MNNYDGIDKKIVDSVRKFAWRLQNILSMDIDDIEQELMYRILTQINKFDHKRGTLCSFVFGLLQKFSVDLIRHQSRDKRAILLFSIPYDDLVGSSRNFFVYHDLSCLIQKLPHKYQLFYQLLEDNSITEISKITQLPRTSVNRDIKLLASFVTQFRDSENNLGLDLLIRRKFKMKNLSTIETMNTKELSSLEVFDLADLSDQVTKLLSHAKELKAKLDDALNLRFSETVKENLRLENKDTGITKFIDHGFQIVAEVPKKVTWDSQKIEEIIKTIPESHRRDYIKTTHSIDERIYSNFSYEYQLLFKPARTVTPGKTKFQIKLPEANNLGDEQ